MNSPKHLVLLFLIVFTFNFVVEPSQASSHNVNTTIEFQCFRLQNFTLLGDSYGLTLESNLLASTSGTIIMYTTPVAFSGNRTNSSASFSFSIVHLNRNRPVPPSPENCTLGPPLGLVVDSSRLTKNKFIAIFLFLHMIIGIFVAFHLLFSISNTFSSASQDDDTLGAAADSVSDSDEVAEEAFKITPVAKVKKQNEGAFVPVCKDPKQPSFADSEVCKEDPLRPSSLFKELEDGTKSTLSSFKLNSAKVNNTWDPQGRNVEASENLSQSDGIQSPGKKADEEMTCHLHELLQAAEEATTVAEVDDDAVTPNLGPSMDSSADSSSIRDHHHKSSGGFDSEQQQQLPMEKNVSSSQSKAAAAKDEMNGKSVVEEDVEHNDGVATLCEVDEGEESAFIPVSKDPKQPWFTASCLTTKQGETDSEVWEEDLLRPSSQSLIVGIFKELEGGMTISKLSSFKLSSAKVNNNNTWPRWDPQRRNVEASENLSQSDGIQSHDKKADQEMTCHLHELLQAAEEDLLRPSSQSLIVGIFKELEGGMTISKLSSFKLSSAKVNNNNTWPRWDPQRRNVEASENLSQSDGIESHDKKADEEMTCHLHELLQAAEEDDDDVTEVGVSSSNLTTGINRKRVIRIQALEAAKAAYHREQENEKERKLKKKEFEIALARAKEENALKIEVIEKKKKEEMKIREERRRKQVEIAEKRKMAPKVHHRHQHEQSRGGMVQQPLPMKKKVSSKAASRTHRFDDETKVHAVNQSGGSNSRTKNMPSHTKEAKHTDIVSPFVSVLEQKHAPAPAPVRRDVKVNKALEAADVRKMKKENAREMVLSNKKEEEEEKKKEAADVAAATRKKQKRVEDQVATKRNMMARKEQQQKKKVHQHETPQNVAVAAAGLKKKKKKGSESVTHHHVIQQVTRVAEKETKVVEKSPGQETSHDISPYQSSDDEDDLLLPTNKFVPSWASERAVAMVPPSALKKKRHQVQDLYELMMPAVEDDFRKQQHTSASGDSSDSPFPKQQQTCDSVQFSAPSYSSAENSYGSSPVGKPSASSSSENPHGWQSTFHSVQFSTSSSTVDGEAIDFYTLELELELELEFERPSTPPFSQFSPTFKKQQHRLQDFLSDELFVENDFRKQQHTSASDYTFPKVKKHSVQLYSSPVGRKLWDCSDNLWRSNLELSCLPIEEDEEEEKSENLSFKAPNFEDISYQITPYQSGEFEFDLRTPKFVPSWARKTVQPLQQELDPETIFHVGSFCDIDEVFLPWRPSQVDDDMAADYT